MNKAEDFFEVVKQPEYALKQLQILQEKYSISNKDMESIKYNCRIICICKEEN